MKVLRHIIQYLLIFLAMIVSSIIYISLSILLLDKIIEPNFDETGVMVMGFVVSFLVIGLIINCLVSIGILKLIYKFFDKDVYDFIPLYSLVVGLITLFMTLLKLFIDYYKKHSELPKGKDEFLTIIITDVLRFLDQYTFMNAFILTSSVLVFNYAKSKKEMKEKKEIEHASYYIYKTSKTKDKKILSYTVHSEINTKTKLKQKKWN